MADDVAYLGFGADSSEIKEAFRDLDRLGDQAEVTERQVVKGSRSSEAAFKRTGQAARGMGGEVNRANDPVRRMVVETGKSNQSLRMMSMQLSQVASQGAATGNYLQALAIQAPDLALGFGAIGIAAGALVPILYGVAQGIFATGEEMEDIEGKALTAYEGMAGLVDQAREAQERYAQAITLTGAAQSLVTSDVLASLKLEAQARQAMADVEAARAEREMRTLEASIPLLQEQVRLIGERVRAEMETALAGADSDQERAAIERQIAEMTRERLDNSWELTGQLRVQQAELDLIRSLMAQNNGEAVEMIDALIEQQSSSRAVADAVASIDFSTSIQGAIDLAAELDVSLHKAMQLMGLVGAAAQAARDKENVIFDPRDPRYNSFDANLARVLENPGTVSPFDPSRIPKPKRGRSGGRGGGGQSEAQKQHNDRLRDAQRIYEQTRTAAEQYAAEVADLNELHKLGYLDADTFGRAIAALDEEFNGAGWLDDVQAGIEGVSSALAQAAVNGENMGEALVGALRNVAAAMLETQIHNGLMALAGALLGKPVSMGSGGLLSFDGGGYTGSGSRSGGMDGKGGFLAMLHPNETVVDHSKGQGMGGVTVVQHLHLSMGATEAAQAEIARAAPKIRAAAEQGIMDRMRRTPGGRL